MSVSDRSNPVWGAVVFVGFWVVLAIGSNMENATPDGKARIESTYDQAAKNIADRVECDQINYPELCQKIRAEAEADAREKLRPFR